MRTSYALPLVAAFAIGAAAPAQADAFKPSKKDQITLGKRAAAEIRRKERVLPASDPRVRTLRRVAQRLLAEMDDRNEGWEYSFDVIDNQAVNAFALPGGPVFFYTGIMEKMRTEDELAGVLAHELTHVRREHWAYAYADQQKRQLGLVALLTIFGANRATSNIAGIANELLFTLPYSRSHETQSDEQGFDLMVQAGYNPQGMVDVFTMLQKQGGGGGPEFLSTHPDAANRVRRLQERINASSSNYPAQRPLRFNGRWQDADYQYPRRDRDGLVKGR